MPRTSHIGGYTVLEQPHIPADHAQLLWTAAVDRSVLHVDCYACPSRDGGLDFAKIDLAQVVAIDSKGHQHICITDGFSHLRIDVENGTVLQGSVAFRVSVGDVARLPTILHSLTQLDAIWRAGKFPPPVLTRTYHRVRTLMALRIHDALIAGASQRDLGRLIFGSKRVASDWNGTSDALRSQIRRLIQLSAELSAGGYRRLLQ